MYNSSGIDSELTDACIIKAFGQLTKRMYILDELREIEMINPETFSP